MALEWHDEMHRARAAVEKTSEGAVNAWLCFREKYRALPMHEKIMDGLVMLAVLYTLMYVIVEHFHLSETLLHSLHSFDMGFSAVFIADLARTYYKTMHPWKFIRHHWLDITACIVALIAFSAVFYAGIGRLSYLIKVEKLHKVTKFYHLAEAGEVFSAG